MKDRLEYIDAYFNGELNESERQQFEEECRMDEAFAQEVAFYITARSAAREALLEQKQQWQTGIANTRKKVPNKSVVLQWLPYAAAACLLFAIAFYAFSNSKTPQRLASNYIKENYAELNQTMDASRDSMQLGIAEYNNKNYQRALVLFDGVKNKDSANSDSKKYAGLAYLQLNNYDKALQCFTELSALKVIYNAGDVLQATTLLQRNAPGDKERAKGLLKKVVTEHEVGSDVAKKILAKW